MQPSRELEDRFFAISILPICSYCRDVRDDANYWQSVEEYISRHTNSHFSHGICPSCLDREIQKLEAMEPR